MASVGSPQERTPRKAMVTLGPCTVAAAEAGYRCPCKAGRYIAPDANPDSSACSTCFHPISQHLDYDDEQGQETTRQIQGQSSQPGGDGPPRPTAPPETNPADLSRDKGILSKSHISPRRETVLGLAHLLDCFRVVHVRGTPSSGKTTLARLLYEHLSMLGEDVVMAVAWHEVNDAISHLINLAEQQGCRGLNRRSFLSSNVVIILDEAQHSYQDLSLWLGLIKTQSGMTEGPRLCLFSSYGSPTSGRADYPLGTTPVHFGPEQRVSITASSLSENHVQLFYDWSEFQDAVYRRSSCPESYLPLDDDAVAYLFEMTNGHPAATNAIILFLFKEYRSAIKHDDIKIVTRDLLIRAVNDDSRLFRMLESYSVYRSFPSIEKITVDAAAVLRDTLQFGSVPRDLQKSGLRECYEKGWVHSEARGAYGADLVCVLPSRLHEKFVEYFLGTINPRPFPFNTYPTLQVLCEALIRKFSKSRLQMSTQGRLGAAARMRPQEAQFQDELYCAFNSLLGPGHAISSEWSRSGQGRIDYRIVEPGWGIEILRDGDRISEHCNRFVSNGAYHDWITNGWIRDWMILDCRHTAPQRYNIPGTKMWRVVFGEEYSSAKVLDCNNKAVVEEFPLLN